MPLPSPTAIHHAARRLHGAIARTPLVASPALSADAGADVWLKCEQLQHTGSFKLRGAWNALALLPDEVRARGVVASSAGNHGLGLAYAARALGVAARIFVPRGAPRVKVDGIAALGAEVVADHDDYDAAHHAAQAFARAHDLTFVNPCAGDALLAGQGTVALEILEECPDLRTIVVPVGGGGLLGGVAGLLRAAAPRVRIIGVQSETTNAMHASLAADRVVSVPVPPTLAEGLAGQVDDAGLAIAREALDDLVLVSEAAIAEAIAWLARAHDMRVEGSGAVGVAALRGRIKGLRGPVVVVLSGGNIDDARWRSIVRASEQDTVP